MYQLHDTHNVSFWRYGWVFAAETLGHAWGTICRVGDWTKWTYRVEAVGPNDIDYPKEVA